MINLLSGLKGVCAARPAGRSVRGCVRVTLEGRFGSPSRLCLSQFDPFYSLHTACLYAYIICMYVAVYMYVYYVRVMNVGCNIFVLHLCEF